MKIPTMRKVLKTLNNEELKALMPVRKKDDDGTEKMVAVSIFSKEAQAEASRRRRKRDRKLKKFGSVAALGKAA